MARTLIGDTPGRVGDKVMIKGWVHVVRDHGKLTFADVYDRSGMIQMVLKSGEKVGPQDAIELEGEVKKRPDSMVNDKIPTGEVEIEVSNLKVISKSQELPFDMGADDLNLAINTLLDNRSLTLKHLRQRAIFEIESTLSNAFGEFLAGQGFVRIHTPKIVAAATEGGANLFEVKYFERKAFLAQSPQFYKQIGAGAFERVFEIGPVFRAEEHDTARHVNEYTSLDLEMSFIDSMQDLMDMERDFLKFAFEKISEKNALQVKLLDVQIPTVADVIPQIKLADAQAMLKKEYGRDVVGEPDLDPEDERKVSEYFKEKEGSDFVFVTHYPRSKRPFYAMPDPDDPEMTVSFDLLFRGLEVTTGGERIHDYNMLSDSIKSRGLDPKNFEYYLQAFAFGMPPEGGLAIGLERLTARLLGIDNVRETTLFPRDLSRLVP